MLSLVINNLILCFGEKLRFQRPQTEKIRI